MNKFRWDSCPLCRSRNLHFVGNIAYRKPVIFSTNEIELTHTPELWRCRHCLSCFVQNSLDENTAEILYSSGQAGDRWSTLAFDQNKMRNVINIMAQIFKNKGRVLDVGCNTGELLDFAHKFGCNTSGLEFSSTSRGLIVNKGHHAYSTFEECPGKYDVITAFDLVEHLYDVPEFLRICREKLTEKGRLVILTGNISSLSSMLAGSHWWYTQYPEHIVFPSKRYFSGYSGFQIEKWMPTYASPGYKYPVFQIFRGVVRSLIRMNYAGLPSFGPDHSLIVLKK
ncbi:MAG: class I SAM-dependent methyltransferase [Marinicellaceae bacterium]